jgi:excisionase family DNA binding protein
MKKTAEAVEQDREQYLTVAQVAARLQVCEKTIRNHISQEGLQAVRVGRAIRISEAALRKYRDG